MKNVWQVVSVVALLAAMVVTATSSSADDKKDPTIKEIMTKAHKGGDSLIQTVGKELKAGDPDWADIQKKTKQLVELGTSLGKNEPPKGEQKSWEKLTKQYLENAKALNTAVEKKDKKDALAAHKKLTGMCATCHKAHKG
jgi:hypothetical protein